MDCGSCGTENPAAARFCLSCGHPLVIRSDERRVATVVFADLVGFTSLSESRDPEQIKNLVDRCFARLARDITEFGGQVDKIVGDAMLALFGAPVAHEDDAERAVRAALRMQESIAAFQDHAKLIVQMRVGVNTGEVLVGSFHAGGEYTAMGDVVNSAQRLQTEAEPGTVIVGPATYAATKDSIDYEPLGEFQAKGRDGPLVAWRAVEPVLPPGYRRRRPESPFVGRETELGVLAHFIDGSVERSRGHLVLLFGEAGVGKSRLAEEAAYLAKVKHNALVIEGRCVPYGEANVFWPVAEAIRQACEIAADDPLPDAQAKASAAVGASLQQPENASEVVRIVNGLLFLMGYEVSLRDIDPARAREEAMRAVLVFVEASAKARPVVLIVSDLHWADDRVLETVDALLDRLRGSRFMLLATARQELQDRWRIPQGRHNTMLLNLDPLDREATDCLLASLVDDDVHGDLREVLLDRSGGNPFFLEELVALLADSEEVPREIRRTDASSLSDLPDTFRGLVSARLDTLSSPERSILEDASVWGRTGPISALERMGEHIHGFSPAAVGVSLADLADKEILQVVGGRFSFHSDLIREVAYGTLTKADRARRHAGIASFLEVGQPVRHDAPDRTVDVIAYHYGAGAELVNELGAIDGLHVDLTAKALDWIEEAAHRAEVSQLLQVASKLYSRALHLLVPGEKSERRVRYLLGRGLAETELRNLEVAKGDIVDAVELAASLDEPALVARSILARGEFEQKTGDIDAALISVQDAVDRFVEIGDRKGEADSLRVLGMTHIFHGGYDAAEVSISGALDASRELEDKRGEAWALQNLSWISYIEGRADEADERLQASAAMFQELGDSGGLSWALGLLAFVRFHQGHLFEAEQLGEQILIEARDRGDRWGEGMMLLLMSGVKLWSGRASAAADDAQGALDLFNSIGDRFGQAQASASVGRALVTSGRIAEGLRVLRESLDGHTVLDPAGEPDQLRLLIAVGLAGAAVQIGAADLALDALMPGDVPEMEPKTIGHSDGLVAEALALLQRGDIESGVERLLAVTDTDHGEPSPYAQSVLALALSASGHSTEVEALAESVRGARRATYLDKVNARLAELFVSARAAEQADGDDIPILQSVVHDRYDLLVVEADGADDPVAQAVARLAGSVALETAGDPQAETLRVEAERRLDTLGITGAGWRRLFAASVRKEREPFESSF